MKKSIWCIIGLHNWERYGPRCLVGETNSLHDGPCPIFKYQYVCLNCGKKDRSARRKHLKMLFRPIVRERLKRKVLCRD